MGESCPKCGTAKSEARMHCAKCGLAYAKMADFAQSRDDIPDALAEAWQIATEHWSEPARHDEVLRLTTQHDAYAWAAAKYRERIKQRPDDSVAQAQLDRVARAAEATLIANAMRPKKEPEPYRATMVFLGLLIIAVIAGLVYVMARGNEPGPPHRDTNPPAEAK